MYVFTNYHTNYKVNWIKRKIKFVAQDIASKGVRIVCQFLNFLFDSISYHLSYYIEIKWVSYSKMKVFGEKKVCQ